MLFLSIGLFVLLADFMLTIAILTLLKTPNNLIIPIAIFGNIGAIILLYHKTKNGGSNE
jgi:hypothetical protein